MQYSTNYGYASAAEADVESRAGFIVRTYVHLFFALAAFVLLLGLWFVTPVAELVLSIFQYGKFALLLFMGAFVGVSALADRLARSEASQVTQYAGLALYTVAESILFIPLIALALMATMEGDTYLLPKAGLVTLTMFGSLTGVVLITRKDFSFLRGILLFGAIAATVIVLMSILFGFSLGAFFSYAMVALACGYILYHTSNVLHQYRTDQHVGAALALFSSVTLLLWYVLRIMMSRRS